LESFGRYYSSYRALVYDRDDVENRSRLKLVIPEVGGNEPYEYWALPKGVYAGNGYGVQMIPQNGDLVWVEFESGHPDLPIWSNGYYGTGEVPTDKGFSDKDSIWLKTPKGIVVNIKRH
jgi:hypothetical protein